jgi:rhodanese-related sulfurtransferase
MSLPAIKPSEAHRLLDGGAVLIDIRETDEHAREKIPGARHLPLSKLDDTDLAVHQGQPIIFHCKSGARTQTNAPRLAGKLAETCKAFIVEGGLDAWRKAGLAVVSDRHQPLELQRQVQIGAGSLAVVGTLLGLFVLPWFFGVPAFVGAGLITAGVTAFAAWPAF